MKKELSALIAGTALSFSAAAQQKVYGFPHVLPVIPNVFGREVVRTVHVKCDRISPEGRLTPAFYAQYDPGHRQTGFAQSPIVRQMEQDRLRALEDRDADSGLLDNAKRHVMEHGVKIEEIMAAHQYCLSLQK